MFFETDKEIIFERETKEVEEYKNSFEGNWKIIGKDDIKIGDIVYVHYMTFSQRYMFDYVDECGRVKKIKKNKETNDTEGVSILNHKKKIVNILKLGCGFYGTGYEIIIYRLENKDGERVKRKREH